MFDKLTNEKFKRYTPSPLKKIIRYGLLFAFIMCNLSYLVYAREGVIKVGVYDNPPILFKDDVGKYKGLSIEVLEYIASEEGWDLEYVSCDWHECLKKLEHGKIDILVYIAYSEKRAQKYDFTHETLFSNWGQVFSQSSSNIESILDLNQKTVALLQGAIHNAPFRELMKKLNIESKIIEVNSNHSVLRLLSEKKVDAGVVNRVFGDTEAGKYNINKTSIIFNPIEIRYAMPKGKNHDLAIAIDKRLKTMKKDKGSIYHMSLSRTFEDIHEFAFPRWIKWALAFGIGIFLIFLLLSIILKQQVKRKTNELVMKNIDLEKQIDERKRTEEELRLHSEIAANIAEGVFLVRVDDGVIVYTNPAFEQMFGYEPGEMIGNHVSIVNAPSDKSPGEIAEQIFEILDKTGSWKGKINNIKKDGTSFWCYANVSMFDHLLFGKVIVTVHTDITERIQTREALRKSEGRYRALFEDNPIETIVVDEDGRITMYNKAKKTSGDRLPRIGDVMYKDYAASHLIDMHQELMECIKLGKPRNFSDQNYKGKFLEMRMFPFGEGAIITAIDRTEKNNLENKLRRAQKMEAMGLMAGGIAHDLNNILSGIVSYPELLLMDIPVDSPMRKPMETIMESGMRAADVVADLMTIARGVATSKEVMNFNTVVEEHLDSTEHQHLVSMRPSVTFKTQFDSDLLNVNGSPTHIKKSLMNLVINASEAISGSGTVTISTMNQYLDEPLRGYEDVVTGEYIVLTVSDDGSGISQQDLERIFEPFYSKKVMDRSGTGLGLAVVWNTVQDHNGYINAKSGEKGTVFELYFPVTREEVAAVEEEVPSEDYLGHGEKILVVDDEERQREIANGILTRLGYNAEVVSSGEEAIEYVKENPVDLIVLDMVMPKGINGRMTYEEIIKIRPGQKAIIASGYAKTKEVDMAQELGAGKYIKKPYTLEKVGLAVKEELEK